MYNFVLLYLSDLECPIWWKYEAACLSWCFS